MDENWKDFRTCETVQVCAGHVIGTKGQGETRFNFQRRYFAFRHMCHGLMDSWTHGLMGSGLARLWWPAAGFSSRDRQLAGKSQFGRYSTLFFSGTFIPTK